MITKTKTEKKTSTGFLLGNVSSRRKKIIYNVHLMQKAKSLEKTLMLGKTESRKKRGQERMRRLDGVTDSMDTRLSKLWVVKDRKAWRAVVHGVAMSQT